MEGTGKEACLLSGKLAIGNVTPHLPYKIWVKVMGKNASLVR